MKVSFNKPAATTTAAPAAPTTSAAPAPAPTAAVEVITAPVPTPVEAVVVETVTTVAAPVAPAPAPEPAAPVGETIITAPAPAIAMNVTDNTGAVAVIPKAELAVEKAPTFYNDDDMEASDLVLPRFNVVQKVGELSTQFTPGTILLNGQLELSPAPKGNAVSKPVTILVVGFQPTIFTEKVDGGMRGNMFKSEAEVVAAGGTLDWNEAQATDKVLYQRLATAMILVEQPEGLDDTSFPTVLDGKNYALALYSMKGTSYTNATKPIKSAKKVGHLKKFGYRGGFWTFASQLKKFGENYAYSPVVRPAGPSTEKFRAELTELLGF